jgi:hypothetical protein
VVLLFASACANGSDSTAPGDHVGTKPSFDASTPSGAVFTSTNPSDDTNPVDQHNLCQNSKDSDAPAINCNLYFDKSFVWLSGGPGPSGLSEGDYVFAVLDPGGQQDPNDCTDANLSDDPTACPTSNTDAGDTWEHRQFHVDENGAITYTGTGGHTFESGMIRLMPYDNTPNPGGEYVMAVCSLTGRNEEATNGPGVDPSLCKYDNFKIAVRDPTTCPNPDANDCQIHTSATLTIEKTLDTKWDKTFTWQISKDVDKTLVEQNGGTATFNYTVKASHDAGTDAFSFSGTVTVKNTSSETAHNVVVTDLVGGASFSCAPFVSGSDLAPGDQINCTYSETGSSSADVTNSATVAWTTVDANGDPQSPTATDQKTKSYTVNNIDECVDVTDPNAPNSGVLGTACSNDVNNPISFTYSKTVNVVANVCTKYDNTATFTTNDNGTTGTASKSVTVCGTASGALTMGFWQNKNGQAIITGQAKTGTCPSATWLRQFAPFQDLSATATCAQVGTYDLNVFNAATCTSSDATCNKMLKAQMLSTALDVYFSDPALGGNKIGASVPVGGLKIDLTKVCFPINAGPPVSCGGYVNTSGAFGPANALKVSEMLTFAATKSNVGGTTWYAQVKATQVLAKDAFDAINNAMAFIAP